MTSRREKGAVTTEFSFVVVLLLLVIFSVFEFGRFVIESVSVSTAAREAARYGVGRGDGPAGVPRYANCDEIRDAARERIVFAQPTDAQISVTFDDGNGGNVRTCPARTTITPSTITSGDRIIVTISDTFTTAVPLIGDFMGSVPIDARPTNHLQMRRQ